MWLVSLQIRGSVAINHIFGLIWRRYGQKRDILDFWGKTYFVYDPIILYRRIKVNRVETKDMGIYHWKNGVIGTFIISISTTVLIVQDKILW